MLKRLRSLFRTPRTVGEPHLLRRFEPPEKTITVDGVNIEGDAWCLHFEGPRTLRLFELTEPGIEKCSVTYRAEMKSDGIEPGAYLEMWCRFPGLGEFFSKGLHTKIRGTTEWASYEIPFLLKEGQRPDVIKLNVVSEGQGTLWLKNVEVLSTELDF